MKDLSYTASDANLIWRLKDVNVSKPLTDRGTCRSFQVNLDTLTDYIQHGMPFYPRCYRPSIILVTFAFNVNDVVAVTRASMLHRKLT